MGDEQPRSNEDKLISIFIPGNVPSSKNSKEIIRFKKNGKWISGLTDSKLVKKYYETTKLNYMRRKPKFHKLIDLTSPPYRIEFTFVRNSKHQFDYVNPLQTVQDQMVKT